LPVGERQGRTRGYVSADTTERVERASVHRDLTWSRIGQQAVLI